jgi:ADP-ribose pyrophosphatase YjhB (NUDIX family)
LSKDEDRETEVTREYPEHPLVGVGVVIFRGPELLLIRRGKPPRLGQWSLPGGLQELGETVFQCAKREALEECGVEIEPVAVIDVVDSITRDGEGRARFHYTLVEVLAEWRRGEPRAGGDALAVGWHDPAKAAELGMWSETVRVIARAAELRAHVKKR